MSKLLLMIATLLLAVLLIISCGGGSATTTQGLRLVYEADLSGIATDNITEIMNGVISVIIGRIGPIGIIGWTVFLQGTDQIVVEIPGAFLTDKQIERIGRTALLEFHELVIEDGKEIWVPATGTINGEEKVLSSSYFEENTYVHVDDFGNILLVFEWNEEGSQLSEQITSRLIGEPLGIFEGDEPLWGEDGLPIAPIIQAIITDRGQIEGLSLNEATELSKQLNAGSLPVPLTIIEFTQNY
jgi:preprotein translocase subunit SecD